MTQTASTFVQSHDEVTQLAAGTISLQATYSFQNPYSINGPFGSIDLTITSTPSGLEAAFGDLTIQTLFGVGTLTKLHYTGTASFNGSTGYTTVKAEGIGTINSYPDHPKPVKAAIQLSLAPGFQSGTITVQGFLSGFALTPTSLRIGDPAS